MLKNLGKKLFLLFTCSAGVVIVLAREFSRGVTSPLGFRVATLILALVMGVYAVFIIIKFAKEYRTLSGTAGVFKEGASRNRRLMEVRLGQGCIVILLILLVSGLRRIERDTVLPFFAGAAINLGITIILIRWVIRLRKRLNCTGRVDRP